MATSFIQSAINFPVSTLSRTEFSTPFFLNNSANLSKISFLNSGEVLDHTPLLKAFLETFTAKSTSFELHFATAQRTSPVAGFIVSNLFPSIESTYLPFINARPSNFSLEAIDL